MKLLSLERLGDLLGLALRGEAVRLDLRALRLEMLLVVFRGAQGLLARAGNCGRSRRARARLSPVWPSLATRSSRMTSMAFLLSWLEALEFAGLDGAARPWRRRLALAKTQDDVGQAENGKEHHRRPKIPMLK